MAEICTRLAALTLALVSVIISSEVGSFIFLRYRIGIGWTPDYLRPAPQHSEKSWLTENSPWGAWHNPNQTARHDSSCFSVALRSNSYGARDRERDRDGNPHRTVVLGDSFAEGWGVEEDERLTNLLEARLGREFLNFGTENDAGPLQYQILYQQLASRFSHDHVLIMFLPDNDFTDNSLAYWSKYRPDYEERHRPYYQSTGGHSYRPFYPVGSDRGAARSENRNWLERLGRTLQRNSWSAGMYRYLILRFHRGNTYSGYFDFTQDQIDGVLWSFKAIKALAGERPVTIVVIPRPNDFIRVRASGTNPLFEILSPFGRQANIEIIDLLQSMPRLEPRIDRYFLPCDGHWSAEGGVIAATVVANEMKLPPASR